MLTKILDDIFLPLNQREKDILGRRFGFEGEEETLEELAYDYNLTRERIRQLQNRALGKVIPLIESHREINKIIERSKKFLKPIGVRREHSFLNSVQNEFGFSLPEIKIFKFLTIFSPKIILHEGEEDLHNFYADNEKVRKICRYLLKKIYLHFLETEKLYSEDELLNLIFKEIKKYLGIEAKDNDLLDFLKILKNISKNPFNLWGLRNHNFITPKCLKDKLILIFKIEKRPLHFKEIYQKLNEITTIKDPMIHYLWYKNYNLNSIKNELIRHPDFVLVKRGVYYLKND
jgi:hypothetical protein